MQMPKLTGWVQQPFVHGTTSAVMGAVFALALSLHQVQKVAD